jgi:hypothetical protein
MQMSHVDDSLWLSSLLNNLQLGTAIPLVVTDIDGQLGRLQSLEAVALTATPLEDVLRIETKVVFMAMTQTKGNNSGYNYLCMLMYAPQNNNWGILLPSPSL